MFTCTPHHTDTFKARVVMYSNLVRISAWLCRLAWCVYSCYIWANLAMHTLHSETSHLQCFLVTWYLLDKGTIHIYLYTTCFSHCPVSHSWQGQWELPHQVEWLLSSRDGPVCHSGEDLPSGTVDNQVSYMYNSVCDIGQGRHHNEYTPYTYVGKCMPCHTPCHTYPV